MFVIEQVKASCRPTAFCEGKYKDSSLLQGQKDWLKLDLKSCTSKYHIKSILTLLELQTEDFLVIAIREEWTSCVRSGGPCYNRLGPSWTQSIPAPLLGKHACLITRLSSSGLFGDVSYKAKWFLLVFLWSFLSLKLHLRTKSKTDMFLHTSILTWWLNNTSTKRQRKFSNKNKFSIPFQLRDTWPYCALWAKASCDVSVCGLWLSSVDSLSTVWHDSCTSGNRS